MTTRLVTIRLAGLAFAALAISTIAQPAHAANECVTNGRFQLTSAGPWPMGLATRGDDECRGFFRTFGDVTLKNLYLTRAPASGKVRLQQGGYFYYKANKGFRGIDPFGMRICGVENGIKGCTDIAMEAHVR